MRAAAVLGALRGNPCAALAGEAKALKAGVAIFRFGGFFGRREQDGALKISSREELRSWLKSLPPEQGRGSPSPSPRARLCASLPLVAKDTKHNIALREFDLRGVFRCRISAGSRRISEPALTNFTPPLARSGSLAPRPPPPKPRPAASSPPTPSVFADRTAFVNAAPTPSTPPPSLSTLPPPMPSAFGLQSRPTRNFMARAERQGRSLPSRYGRASSQIGRRRTGSCCNSFAARKTGKSGSSGTTPASKAYRTPRKSNSFSPPSLKRNARKARRRRTDGSRNGWRSGERNGWRSAKEKNRRRQKYRDKAPALMSKST